MKTIIAGSSNIFNITFVFEIINTCPWLITEVISGDGGCVDFLGAYWGYLNGKPVRHFPAKWRYFGRGAGIMRNKVMIDHANALIYIWNGKSNGTKDVVNRAYRNHLSVWPPRNPNGSFRSIYD